jgi:hypothetical protein
MRITATGSVGIGTTSPSHKLQVANSSATSTTLLANILARLQSNATGADVSLQFSDNVTNSAGISLNQGNLTFSIAGSSAAQIDTSANFKFNSGYGSVATAYGCRAWVNFNGATNAIRTSGNVSSITDQGTGIWQISFSNTLPNANYSVQCLTSGQYNSAHTVAYVGAGDQDFASYVPPAPTTSSFYILTCNPTNGGHRAEGTQMMVSVFR